jgi:hypothetical protein
VAGLVVNADSGGAAADLLARFAMPPGGSRSPERRTDQRLAFAARPLAPLCRPGSADQFRACLLQGVDADDIRALADDVDTVAGQTACRERRRPGRRRGRGSGGLVDAVIQA